MDYIISFFLVMFNILNGLSIIHLSGFSNFLKENKTLNFSFAFFIGTIFLIVSIKTVGFIFSNLLLGVIGFFIISMFSIYFSKSYIIEIYKKSLSLKTFLIFIFSFLISFLILSIYWLQHSDLSNAFATIGSLHSVRYVELAQYMLINNYSPIIGQNSGQSTITYLSLLLGVNSGYVTLTIFLTASIIFISFIIYYLFNLFIKNRNLSVFATLIFLTANTALSTNHILIIDSGSPFFVNGYTDTIIGIFTILSFILIYKFLYSLDKIGYKEMLILLILLIGSFFSAPQNIILFTTLIGFLFVLKIYKKICIKHFKTITILIFFSSVIAIPQGGMLTPKKLHENLNIPGMMSISSMDKNSISIAPGVFHYSQYIDTFHKDRYDSNIIEMAKSFKNKDYRLVLLYLEDIFVMSLRMLFFPISGFILLFLYSNKLIQDEENLYLVNFIKISGVVFFAVGFLISFSIAISGHKWELVRFLIPGIVLGLFSFILIAFLSFKKRINHFKLKVCGLFILMSLAPVTDFILTIDQRFIENSNPKILKEKLEAFHNIKKEGNN